MSNCINVKTITINVQREISIRGQYCAGPCWYLDISHCHLFEVMLDYNHEEDDYERCEQCLEASKFNRHPVTDEQKVHSNICPNCNEPLTTHNFHPDGSGEEFNACENCYWGFPNVVVDAYSDEYICPKCGSAAVSMNYKEYPAEKKIQVNCQNCNHEYPEEG